MGEKLLAIIDSYNPEEASEESVIMQLSEKISKGDPILNQLLSEEHTLLIAAIRRGQSQVVRFLLSLGANPRLTSPGQYTPIHWAAALDSHTILQCLAEEYGVDIHSRTAGAETTLTIAACANNLPVADYLLSHPFDISAQDKDGLSALHWAALNGNITLVNLLLEKLGPDGNIHPRCHLGRETQNTPLECAAIYGYQDIVIALSKKNPAHFYNLALIAAARRPDYIQSELLDFAEINANKRALITFLLSNGAQISFVNEDNTALIAAIRSIYFDTLEFLVEHCHAPIQEGNTFMPKSVIAWAVCTNDPVILHYLLRRLDFTRLDPHFIQDALAEAFRLRHPNMVTLLVNKYGANIHYKKEAEPLTFLENTAKDYGIKNIMRYAVTIKSTEDDPIALELLRSFLIQTVITSPKPPNWADLALPVLENLPQLSPAFVQLFLGAVPQVYPSFFKTINDPKNKDAFCHHHLPEFSPERPKMAYLDQAEAQWNTVLSERYPRYRMARLLDDRSIAIERDSSALLKAKEAFESLTKSGRMLEKKQAADAKTLTHCNRTLAEMQAKLAKLECELAKPSSAETALHSLHAQYQTASSFTHSHTPLTPQENQEACHAE